MIMAHRLGASGRLRPRLSGTNLEMNGKTKEFVRRESDLGQESNS